MKRNWKSQVREICKEAINQSGTSYNVSFRMSDDEDIIYVTLTPKVKKDAYASFHILAVQRIESILYRRCRFISVYDGELEFTFMP